MRIQMALGAALLGLCGTALAAGPTSGSDAGFFFSSRRRHTRWPRDWSSDVCSSDLMSGIVDFARLGGIIPKTVTRQPRAGNPPPRTIETPSGMLNAIDHFIGHHLPYLRTLPTAIIARSEERRVGKECRSRCTTEQ